MVEVASILFFLAIIGLTKSDIIDLVSFPLNFNQAIQSIHYQMNLPRRHFASLNDLTPSDTMTKTPKNQIVDSFNSVLKDTRSLKVSENCIDKMKFWLRGIKLTENWALSG